MTKIETIEDFYKEKIGWLPESLRNDLGHFNVFRSDPYVGSSAKPTPYRRRDYYKIALIYGQSELNFADKVVQIEKQGLLFINPQIPYSNSDPTKILSGFFCVFNQQFFHHFGKLEEYPVYQPDGTHAFELTDEQAQRAESIYLRMLDEINSDYVYKYDILRSLVLELIHFALKMQPSSAAQVKHQLNASERIASLFIELLERQYPIDETNQRVALRSASDFARHLNIHVNHLNRALKEITDKTTTQIITERILKEAKILLKQSAWTVSEIAYALGFVEVAHFNAFFKKNTSMTPLKFRHV
jgi:AraC family transcriptional regulator, transcriptional activator of pobA